MNGSRQRKETMSKVPEEITDRAKELLDEFMAGFLSKPLPDESGDEAEAAREKVKDETSIVYGLADLAGRDEYTVEQRSVMAGFAMDGLTGAMIVSDQAELPEAFVEAVAKVVIDFLVRLAKAPEAMTDRSSLHYTAAEGLALVLDQSTDADKYVGNHQATLEALRRVATAVAQHEKS